MFLVVRKDGGQSAGAWGVLSLHARAWRAVSPASCTAPSYALFRVRMPRKGGACVLCSPHPSASTHYVGGFSPNPGNIDGQRAVSVPLIIAYQKLTHAHHVRNPGKPSTLICLAKV